MAYFDTDGDAHDWRALYALFIGIINPRPIALVSTVSANGTANLAPFSFYNMVSARPPVVMFAPSMRRDGTPKDTLRNIRETREFCIAAVTDDIVRPAVDCAADVPSDASEFDFSGLTPAASRRVKPALVREAAANIECSLRQIVTISDEPSGGSLVLGNVLALHVRDDLLTAEGRVDPHRLRTVGRLGGKWYSTVTEPFELEIPHPDGRR